MGRYGPLGSLDPSPIRLCRKWATLGIFEMCLLPPGALPFCDCPGWVGWVVQSTAELAHSQVHNKEPQNGWTCLCNCHWAHGQANKIVAKKPWGLCVVIAVFLFLSQCLCVCVWEREIENGSIHLHAWSACNTVNLEISVLQILAECWNANQFWTEPNIKPVWNQRGRRPFHHCFLRYVALILNDRYWMTGTSCLCLLFFRGSALRPLPRKSWGKDWAMDLVWKTWANIEGIKESCFAI